MRPRLAIWLTAAVAVVVVAACNALNGSGDLGFDDRAGDGGRSEGGGTAEGGGTNEGGATNDGGPSSDGGLSSDDAGIDPKVRGCGNNQLCLPDTGGWTPATLLLAGAGACPPEFPDRNDAKTSGGGNCRCSCSPAGGSCVGSVDTRSGAGCTGAATNLPVMSNACANLDAGLPLPVSFTAHPSGTTPTSCGASVTSQLQAPQPAAYCTGATAIAGGACDPGEICVKQGGSFPFASTCIVHDGEIACPARLGFRTVVGTAIEDGRSCGTTCACKTSGCDDGTLEAFTSPGCVGSIRSVSVDGTCVMAGAPPSGTSYRYTPSQGCAVSTPAQVLGAETYVGARTLCCRLGF